MAVYDRFLARVMKINPIQRQSLISLASILGITAAGYIATMYFAHVLGPAILGSFFVFLAYYGIFDLVGDGGFGNAAAKRISEGSEQGAYFTGYILLRIALLFFSIGVLLIIAPYLVDLDSSGLFPWLVLSLVVGTGASIVATGIYGTAKVGVQQSSTFITTIVKVVVQVVAVFLGYEAAGLAGGVIVGMIAGALVNFRYLEITLSRCDISHLKRLFSFSFWSFLTAGGALVYAYADTILIGYFMTNTDVGIYRVAFQLTGAAAFTTGALHTVLFPRVSGWHAEKNLGMISHALSRAFTYSLLLAIPVTVGGFVLGDKLIYFLYGAAFDGGPTVLLVLFLVQVANVFMYLETMCLNAMDQPRTSFTVTAIAAGLNIVLNIALIPVIGITGAAVATLCTMVLNALLAYRYLNRLVPVKIERRPLSSVLKASAVMAVVVIVFRLFVPVDHFATLIVAVALGTVVYFPLVLRLESGIRDEVREIVHTLGIPWPAFM